MKEVSDALVAVFGVCLVAVFFTAVGNRSRRAHRSPRSLPSGCCGTAPFLTEDYLDREEAGQVGLFTKRQAHLHSGGSRGTDSYEDEAMNGLTPDEIIVEMKSCFPGMEHYFCSEDKYSPAHELKTESGWVCNPHQWHGGFYYCGFIDCLSFPRQGRVWKSVTLSGLLRLLSSDNPEFIPDLTRIPQTKRRFEL